MESLEGDEGEEELARAGSIFVATRLEPDHFRSLDIEGSMPN